VSDCAGVGDVLPRPAASLMHRPSLSPRPIPFVLLGLSPSPPSTRSAAAGTTRGRHEVACCRDGREEAAARRGAGMARGRRRRPGAVRGWREDDGVCLRHRDGGGGPARHGDCGGRGPNMAADPIPEQQVQRKRRRAHPVQEGVEARVATAGVARSSPWIPFSGFSSLSGFPSS
jgi:hypothetical protein